MKTINKEDIDEFDKCFVLIREILISMSALMTNSDYDTYMNGYY